MKLRNFVAGAILTFVMESAFAVPVILDIKFDNFANETAFGMWTAAMAPSGADLLLDSSLVLDGIAYDVGASSPIGFGDGFVLPGDFAGEVGTFQFVWELAAGIYDFIITDAFGDGICCGEGNGGYRLSVAGVVVRSGGAFSDFESTRFTVVDVPEPGTLALMILGLFGVAARRRGQT